MLKEIAFGDVLKIPGYVGEVQVVVDIGQDTYYYIGPVFYYGLENEEIRTPGTVSTKDGGKKVGEMDLDRIIISTMRFVDSDRIKELLISLAGSRRSI